MKRTTIAIVLLSLTIVCGSLTSVQAWGQDGHKIVAQLALNMLTEQAKEWMHEMLDGQTIVDVATQADAYAYSPGGTWSQPLHYANVGFNQSSFVMSRDCPADFCVVGAVFNYTAQVERAVAKGTKALRVENEMLRRQGRTRPSVPDSRPWHSWFGQWDENVPEPTPLAFVVHFVGDQMQPLHIGFGCDLGGNSVNVTQNWNGDEEVQVLHKIWDTVIIQTHNDNWQSFAQQLQGIIDAQPSISRDALRSDSPIDWAAESFNYTLSDVYWFDYGKDTHHGIEKVDNSSSIGGGSAPRHYPVDTDQCPLTHRYFLDWDYYHHSLAIIERRLMFAGVRLGTLLNRILN